MDYSKLNEAQARAVRSDSPRILTLAGAGTGKTHALTHRIARLYEDGVLPSNMLAITFTRAAGAEMQERIVQMIGPQGKDLTCCTFHSWCLRVIRKFASFVGYKSNLSVYDEDDVLSIVGHIIEDYNYDVDDEKFIKEIADEIINWLLSLGYIPSFCTACYREGRTGDRFMSLAKTGQIANCCQPNALMTLKEYLEDYASEDTKLKGESVIAAEVKEIPNETARKVAKERLVKIANGERDFRF